MKNPFWHSEEQRLRALWRLIAFLLVSAVLTIASGFALARVVPAALANTLATLVGVMAGSWLTGRFLDRRLFASFGFHLNGAWWRDFGFGLFLGTGLMAVTFLVEYSSGWLAVAGTFYTATPTQSFGTGLLTMAVLFLSVGIYEEVLTRGYLLKNLAEGFNVRWLGPRNALLTAWLLSSVLFGVAHLFNPNASLISTLNISVAGLFLGLGYVLTGELAIPIGLHIAWNFTQGPVFGFPVSGLRTPARIFLIEQYGPEGWTGGAFGPEAGLLGLVVMLVGCAGTLAWVRAFRGPPRFRLALAEAPPRSIRPDSS